MSNTGEPSHRPRPHRPRLWQRLLACVLMLTLQVSSFAQVAAPMIRGADGTVSSGYRAEGTLVLGSVVPGATTQVAGASVLAGTSGTVATVGSVVATGIGTTVASVAGAMVSTGIQTGSLDKAIKAGEGALKAGLVTTAVSALVPGLGITNGFLADSVNVVATAAGQTVGYGGDFGDNLFQTVINTGVEVVSQQAAGWIGQQTDWSPLGTELAHAGLGCAAGMVRSGSSGGCAPGATGAVVAHLGAQWLDPASGFTLSDKDVAFFTGLGGGVAAALVGSSDNIQSNFGIGQSTGQNAVEHNYLTTRQAAARQYELDTCASSSCLVGVDLKYRLISGQQDVGLLVGAVGGVGIQGVESAEAVIDMVKNWDETQAALKGILNDPDFREKVGGAIFRDYEDRLELLNRAYNDGGWDGSVTAGVESGRLALDIVGIATGVLGAAKVTTHVAALGSKALTGTVDKLGSLGTNVTDVLAQRTLGGANGIKPGGTVELFTDSKGPQVPGAVGVGPNDVKAIATDARNMPNIPSNSQAAVVANNPFIPRDAGGTGSAMDFLPEALRITQPGGKVILNMNEANPNFKSMPSEAQLKQMGLRIEYQGSLLPEFRGLTFSRSDGSEIPKSTMKTIVLVKE